MAQIASFFYAFIIFLTLFFVTANCNYLGPIPCGIPSDCPETMCDGSPLVRCILCVVIVILYKLKCVLLVQVCYLHSFVEDMKNNNT
ncbi:unnamed protein product [Lathyrus oleraceus]